MIKYKYTNKCNEISGFGGSYEDACRKMVIAGMEYLDNNPDAKITFKTYKNIYGVTFDESEDCEKMQKIMIDATGGDCTGAMMQACLQHIKYAQINGWDKYISEMEKPRAQAKEV